MNKFFSIFFFVLCCLVSCNKMPDARQLQDESITLSPDYKGVSIPQNIAPLNFSVVDSADQYALSVVSNNGYIVQKRNSSGLFSFTKRQWNRLLKNSDGLVYQINLKRDNDWFKYPSFQNTIISDSIDSYVTYRYFIPSFQVANDIGIYRRDLSCFKEFPIVKTDYENICFNCHVYANNDSRYAMFHSREQNIGGTIITVNGESRKIVPKAGGMSNSATYAHWHPSGKFIAFSANDVVQLFYASEQRRDAHDNSSYLVFYDIEKNEFFSDSSLYGNDYLESYPCWDHKGEYLYFSRTAYHYADSVQTIFDMDKYRNVQYDLMRIKFSIEDKSFGTPEYVLCADSIKKSIVWPKISPDGRSVLFCALDYGNFPLFHQESDLWILDLKTDCCQKIESIASPFAEGYHNWSSNGEWIAYSSKALDGEHTTLWFARFDGFDNVGKPFVMPQKDPEYYSSFISSFSVPEFTINNEYNRKALYKVVNNTESIQPKAVKLPNIDGTTGATKVH